MLEGAYGPFEPPEPDPYDGYVHEYGIWDGLLVIAFAVIFVLVINKVVQLVSQIINNIKIRYVDQLIARYGEDAVLDAPIWPEQYTRMGLEVPPSPLSQVETAILRNIYKKRKPWG